jgi:hypothetical protein
VPRASLATILAVGLGVALASCGPAAALPGTDTKRGPAGDTGPLTVERIAAPPPGAVDMTRAVHERETGDRKHPRRLDVVTWLWEIPPPCAPCEPEAACTACGPPDPVFGDRPTPRGTDQDLMLYAAVEVSLTAADLGQQFVLSGQWNVRIDPPMFIVSRIARVAP